MAEAAATAGRARIALVHGGDVATVGHLREALAERFDIAYAGTAAELDAGQLADLRIAAVLVSVDGGDWLEPLADRLDGAGIPLVLDDPAISRKLDGWGRARWLRHLCAKLAGSGNYDPPRPAIPDGAAAAPQGGVATPPTAGEAAPMAARCVGVPDTPDAGTVVTATMRDTEGDMVEPVDGVPAGGPEADDGSRRAPASGSVAPLRESAGDDAAPGMAAGGEAGPAETLALDPDMAALSAMIDSQLAEPAGGASADATGVWRIADGGVAAAAEPVQPDGAAGTDSVAAAAIPAAPPRAHPVSDPVEDAEVLKGLPSDCWQLVEPGADTAPPSGAAPAAEATSAVKSIDIAGLELVPMEESGPVERHSDPIERWMDTAERVTAEAARKRHAGNNGGGKP